MNVPFRRIAVTQCNFIINLNPFLSFRILMFRYCRDILIQTCCTNTVIFWFRYRRLFNLRLVLCLRLLSCFFLCRSFYLIICNIDNLFFVDSGYLICDYISFCVCRVECITVYFNLCDLETVI